MDFAPALSPAPTRRAALTGLAGALAFGGVARAAAREMIITVLGDSITAGLGLPESQALPAQLALRLKALGVSARVRGAGVSGDTTADALARLDFSVQPDTDLCLVALGGNDLLQGVEPAVVQANLSAIVRRLKGRGVKVLIAGMRAPARIGAGYARQFNAVFPTVAHTEHVGLYPFLLDGVASNARLNQTDGLHPNAQGVTVIADRLSPAVIKALAAHR